MRRLQLFCLRSTARKSWFWIACAILQACSTPGFNERAAYLDWSDLGDSLYHAGRYREAAMEYSRAVALRPELASSNAMYNAACSWALAGEADSAFFQLQQVVSTHGYAKSGQLQEDADLQALHADARWAPLVDAVAQNREKQAHLIKAMWKEDVRELRSLLDYWHINAYTSPPAPVWDREVNALLARMDQLDDDEIILEIQRIVALAGDGHTTFFTTDQSVVDFQYLPLVLAQFEEGLFAISASDSLADLAGLRLVAIGDTPIEAVREKLIHPSRASVHARASRTVRRVSPAACEQRSNGYSWPASTRGPMQASVRTAFVRSPMPAVDHNALLKRIARERFAPHGIVQQGGSRTFLKDRDWFTVMIEFQPSSFAQGSYLNVGADLHFFPRDHMAFSHGYRVEGFSDAADADFTATMGTYCDRAVERVHAIERDFASYGSAVRALGRTEKGDWTRYERGFLHALAGHPLRARWHLGRVAAQKAEYDFERERVRMAREVIALLGTPQLADHLQQVIRAARSLKGLPPG